MGCLALAAAALVLASPGGGGTRHATPGPAERQRPAAVARVTTPVRIVEPAVLRLLRPGVRVDVIATAPGDAARRPRVVASRARVVEVPEAAAADVSGGAGGDRRLGATDGGAVVVLSVPRATAVALAGAAMTSSLAVVLC